MPYRYLDDIATADVAFRAWGASREELFAAATDALLNVMVADLAAIRFHETVTVEFEEEAIDLLLFDVLQELVFYKDARQLLLRATTVAIISTAAGLRLSAALSGERIDPARHPLMVDVKAVTFHRFRVAETDKGWEAEVVLDI